MPFNAFHDETTNRDRVVHPPPLAQPAVPKVVEETKAATMPTTTTNTPVKEELSRETEPAQSPTSPTTTTASYAYS